MSIPIRASGAASAVASMASRAFGSCRRQQLIDFSSLARASHQCRNTGCCGRTAGSVRAYGAFAPSLVRSLPRWINSKSGEENDGEDGEDGDGKPPKKQEDEAAPPSSSSTESPSSDANGAPAAGSGSDGGDQKEVPGATNATSVTKPSIPSSYPYPLLALPIARRPLFPGFYKAVVIKDPAVVKGIREMMKRGQPYLGAFLLKEKATPSPSTGSSASSTSASESEDPDADEGELVYPSALAETEDKDTISSLDEVYDVGVFCQVTSVFSAGSASGAAVSGKEGAAPATDTDKEEALTAVLYPHRRIKITELVQPRPDGSTGEIDFTAFTPPSSADGKPPVFVVEEASQEVQDAVDALHGQTGAPEAPKPETEGTPAEGAAEPKVSLMPTSFLASYPISLVRIQNLPTKAYRRDNAHIRAFTSEIVSVFKDIAQLNPLFRDQITNFSINQVTSSNIFDEPDKLADFAAAVSSGSGSNGSRELQAVLEATDVEERLRLALIVLKKELVNAEVGSKLSRDVERKIAKRQREYYLQEQLRNIKKELGVESDGKDRLIATLRTKAAGLKMPEGVRKVFEEELQKLSLLEPGASEANVTRNYLDWITSLPWGVHTPDRFHLKEARRVLDEDHYGLEKLKGRILEFLAVGRLRGSVQGKIICLVGPPGVGKTSVGRSVARCVGRRFGRISVGGLTDVAEVKGHRRTYVGALPGKIIQTLKRCESENPLVLIDEIDKIGRGINGDPASALLEMLDPEQNESFLDHYMDLPVDLSRVLFMCTANTLDTIPAPLLDRMEVIEVSGYVSEEKAVIAERYLGPQAKEQCGLKEADVQITPEAIEMLIKWYARESGVRNLKKYIEKIYRKAALKLVEEHAEEVEVPVASTTAASTETAVETPAADASTAEAATPASESDAATAASTASSPTTTKETAPMVIPASVHMRVTPENLKEYVGPPVYQRDRMFGGSERARGSSGRTSEDAKRDEERKRKARLAPPGVSTGLGYLGNGSGAVMPIEVMSMPGKGSVQLTGKLGEVIRESTHLGLSWVKAHAFELGLTKDASEVYLTDRDIHVHMPEGAVGKDGPSAGTAILVAFVSLFKGVRVDSDIALTGEISLSGQVLPVGGLKEKILAAHRAEIKTIIAPEANRADIEENVPASVKEGIRLVYVENVEEVLEEVFGIRVGQQEELELGAREVNEVREQVAQGAEIRE